MNPRTLKLMELLSLVVLALALLISGIVAIRSHAEPQTVGAFVGGVFTVLPMVVNAMRNIPQGEAMNRMVDYLARSNPAEPAKPEGTE